MPVIVNHELAVLRLVAKRRMSTTEIASEIGISRFAVDRALAKLLDDGLVTGDRMNHRAYWNATEAGKFAIVDLVNTLV